MIRPTEFKISAAIGALSIALLLNCWFETAHPLTNARTINLQRSEIFTARQALSNQWQSPELALLGSSLLVAPVIQAEATYLGQPFPRHEHRQSKFFAKILSEKVRYAPNVISMAVAGSMVSDAYLIAKNLLAGEHKPIAIVYGIAPRDVQDNSLPGVESTETFKVAARVEDLGPMLADSGRAFEKKMDLLLGRVWPFWSFRSDVRTFVVFRTKKLMETCLPWVVFDKYADTLELKPRKRGFYPEEAPGVLMALPGQALEHHDRTKTKEEYLRRYNPVNEKLVGTEFGYLDKLLALCGERQVPVVLLNMPLSNENIKLMPPGFYARFNRTLSDICAARSCPLIDLSTDEFRNDDLFVDGVHLKPEASQYFLSTIRDRLTGIDSLAQIFNYDKMLSWKQKKKSTENLH